MMECSKDLVEEHQQKSTNFSINPGLSPSFFVSKFGLGNTELVLRYGSLAEPESPSLLSCCLVKSMYWKTFDEVEMMKMISKSSEPFICIKENKS